MCVPGGAARPGSGCVDIPAPRANPSGRSGQNTTTHIDRSVNRPYCSVPLATNNIGRTKPMKRGIRHTGIAAILGAAMAMAAASATWAAEQTFRLGVPEDALTLDPIASSDNPSIWAELLIYDTLIRPAKN